MTDTRYGHRWRDDASRYTFLARLTLVALVALAVGVTQSQAQSFITIHSFTGAVDGEIPYAGLTMDQAGDFYGTTSRGGDGYGTVFQLKHSEGAWIVKPLYSFLGGNDGANPEARVIIGPDGTLYGTTTSGGGNGCGALGCGTVFNLRPPTSCQAAVCQWTEVVLYRFTGETDGGVPVGDLVFDGTGTIYGATWTGGKPGSCPGPYGPGCGTVYTLTHSGGAWTEAVIYQFKDFPDGTNPDGGVVFRSGDLYGTTEFGGSEGCPYGCGTVFKLTHSGANWTENLLYNFQAGRDGQAPVAGLIFDASGNLYGTTLLGGTGNGGTVFKLAPSGGNWTLAATYDFAGIEGPAGSIIMDAAGNIYGTTYRDGAQLLGSVFKLTPSSESGWTYSSLHDFRGSDGLFPESNLVMDDGGNLFGTTSAGGSDGLGTIFEIPPDTSIPGRTR